MGDYDRTPLSRNEEILRATIDGTEYRRAPMSAEEELLLELKEKIEEGGGGGGTTNYNALSNKPKINGVELSGNKSSSDLLIDAVTTEDVTANAEVGAIASGETIPSGTGLTDFLKKLLIKEIAPTTTFSASGSGVKEKGTSVKPTLTLKITSKGTGQPETIEFYKAGSGRWSNPSAAPYDFWRGEAIEFENELHIVGGGYNNKSKHSKWNGSSWVEESALGYSFTKGTIVVQDGKLHLLGGDFATSTNHYRLDGTVWNEVSTLPYAFTSGSAVVLNGEIHILGGEENGTKHFKWNGTEWSEVSTLPYSFSKSRAVVLNGEIHILGGEENGTKHFKWNGTEWSEVSTLPYNFYLGMAVVMGDEIHILGNYDNVKSHYKWNGTAWSSVSTLPLEGSSGCAAAAVGGEIYIIGGDDEFGGDPRAFYEFSGTALLESKAYVEGTNTYTHEMAAAITDDTTVKGVLKYKKSDGTTKASIEKTASYTFVMASYYGAVTTAPTDKAGITALTKSVKNSKGQTATFNLNNQRSCYAYPASFGNLTSIKDANNFEYLSSYTKTTVEVDGVDYNVYTLTDPVTATGFKQVYA